VKKLLKNIFELKTSLKLSKNDIFERKSLKY